MKQPLLFCALALLMTTSLYGQTTPEVPAEGHHFFIDIGEAWDSLFIRDGFYGAEGPYPQFGGIWVTMNRWTRQGASLRIPLFPKSDNVISFRADVADVPNQVVHVRLDGHTVARFSQAQTEPYVFSVPARNVGDARWGMLSFEIAVPTRDPAIGWTDPRMILGWVRITGDAPRWDFLREALEADGWDLGDVRPDTWPGMWRTQFDPNNIGNTFTTNHFVGALYDDSHFVRQPSDFAPDLRQGEVMWYRAWVIVDDEEKGREAIADGLVLPGEVYDRSGGYREAWVNGKPVSTIPDTLQPTDIVDALGPGPNIVVVKAMQGPLPRTSGDWILNEPVFRGVWNEEGRVSLAFEPLILHSTCDAADSLHLALVGPDGNTLHEWSGPVTEIATNSATTARGIAPDVVWDFEGWGLHRLVIADGEGHRQEIPIHRLGVHFFHWGWFPEPRIDSPWRAYEPRSLNFVDQLFERMNEWPTPHHSISWPGAIFAPGSGFHQIERVDYVTKFRDAFASGELGFVGMPYNSRNIDTDFGESLLRGMRMTRAIYRSQLNAEPRRFYSHDATMTPRLPQIMALCGYDTYTISENWWGQQHAIPNSRDGYFEDADGTRIRVLDSWYHGQSPTVQAKRAVEIGKPAVLCNEEFACLDATVFLEQDEARHLAAEGIFLEPVNLDTYQELTEDFARQLVYEGDDALCYKGWTGGGPGEVEYEKANRFLETRLVALENLVAFARWLGHTVDQASIDQAWDLSLRLHECHSHWGDGSGEQTERLREATRQVDEQMREVARMIATHVDAASGDVVIVNPLGQKRDALVHIDGAPFSDSTVTHFLTAGHDGHEMEPHLDDSNMLVSLITDLPSVGYRTVTPSKGAIFMDDRLANVTVRNGQVEMRSGNIRIRINNDGVIESAADDDGGILIAEPLHRLYVARANAPVGQPLSTMKTPLNLAHYTTPEAIGPPRVLRDGMVESAVEYDLALPDYPAFAATLRYSLVADERLVRIRLTLRFAEPTALDLPGTRPPHEGITFPAIFAAFPFPDGARPFADMAYCTTNNVLTSTNHATFMNLPFRHGTFNALSCAGPHTGEFAVLTRGLHDFFAFDEQNLFGLVMGAVTGKSGIRYNGEYVHEYALLLPAFGDRGNIEPEAFRTARSLLVEPIAVVVGESDRTLPREASFVEASGDSAIISGVEMLHGELRFRVVQLAPKETETRIRSLVDLKEATVNPNGEIQRGRLALPPRAIREVIVPHPSKAEGKSMSETKRETKSGKPRVYGYHPMENGIPAKGHSMTYLLVGPEGGVLIDPGLGTYHHEVMDFVREHGLEPSDIALCLVTHCHVDHTGGIKPMRAEGIPVACSPWTAEAVKESGIHIGMGKGEHPQYSTDVDRLLEDGEILEVAGMRIQVVATPGHTDGCVAFLVETNEGLTAFTGDLIRHTSQLGWTGGKSFSEDKSVESVNRLLALQPDKAYWGHGEIEEAPVPWLERALKLHQAGNWSAD